MKGRDQRRTCFQGDRVVWLIVLLLALVRLAAFFQLGPMYSLYSDDASYINSGIHFANTGVISIHSEFPSAQAMPGMTYLIGLFSLIFGEGTLLRVVLKLFWIGMGSATGWFLYQSVRLFAPRWCAVIAALMLFRPDFIWADNLILTETPFTLCFTALIYFTFQMGRQPDKRRYFVGCAAAYMAALLLKANIGIYPIFAMVYLLCVKYDFKKLLKQGLVLACALLCFLVPWTIRNYLQFDAFIPLTYGAGNPMLLGTYQGWDYPYDDYLDYESNVDDVVKETYAKYYNADGTIPEKYQGYLALQSDGIKAKYRLQVWHEEHPRRLAVSYLVLKPFQMANDTFYWERVFHIPATAVYGIQYVDMALCIAVVIGMFFSKKSRWELLFLIILYWSNLYLYAMAFAFGRYNMSLMPARFILIGIGLSLLAGLRRNRRAHKT